jgi:hypothetical protein
MKFGNMQQFAIEITVGQVVDEWVFGTFLFWVGGVSVGNQSDTSVDLNGCIRWLGELASDPRERYEPGLFLKSNDEIWRLLVRPVLASFGTEEEEAYPNTFGRFHISHVGMSSFDGFTILLLNDEKGRERLLWQCGSGKVMSKCLGVGTVESVSMDAVAWFRNELAR